MDTSEFDYDLPQELIAKYPTLERTSSKLLFVSKGKTLQERTFMSLPDYLRADDVLILNDTRVVKSRIFGRKESGGRVEFLCTEILTLKTAKGLIKANSRVKVGTRLIFSETYSAVINGVAGDEFFLAFEYSVKDVLDDAARIALPPYQKRDSETFDLERYQTVFSKNPGAIAAPTAGLHFDKPLLERIRAKGIRVGFLTLHVGIGTFKPVKTAVSYTHLTLPTKA